MCRVVIIMQACVVRQIAVPIMMGVARRGCGCGWVGGHGKERDVKCVCGSAGRVWMVLSDRQVRE